MVWSPTVANFTLTDKISSLTWINVNNLICTFIFSVLYHWIYLCEYVILVSLRNDLMSLRTPTNPFVVYIYPTFLRRSEYDSRSIFKWSMIDLNSEFLGLVTLNSLRKVQLSESCTVFIMLGLVSILPVWLRVSIIFIMQSNLNLCTIFYQNTGSCKCETLSTYPA